MDRYERFYRRSLRDVLVGHKILSAELADDLAESAYEASESFGFAVVDAGHLTSRELTKTVAGQYQMPVLPLQGYEYDETMLDGMSAATLFQHQVLPVGRFGRSWSFAVAEPPSRECVAALKEAFGVALFFFAADAVLVKHMVAEHVKVVDATSDKGWQSMFDVADAAINEQNVDPVEPQVGESD